MKKYFIGISSFIGIWCLFYEMMLQLDVSFWIGIPVLLIGFALSLALAKQFTNYLLEEAHKQWAMGYSVLVIGVVLLLVGGKVATYLPKSFEGVLGFKKETVEVIYYDYDGEEDIAVRDSERIEAVIDYLNTFTYHKQINGELSKENLQQRYKLRDMWFISTTGKKKRIDLYGDEMWGWMDFYQIKGGTIDEEVVYTLLK